MNTSRRGLFGLFAGAAVAPWLKLPTFAPVQVLAVSATPLSEIVQATLRAGSPQIMDILAKSNPFLAGIDRTPSGYWKQPNYSEQKT